MVVEGHVLSLWYMLVTLWKRFRWGFAGPGINCFLESLSKILSAPLRQGIGAQVFHGIMEDLKLEGTN